MFFLNVAFFVVFFPLGLGKLACLGGFLGPLALFGAVLGLEEGGKIDTNARKLVGKPGVRAIK